MNKVINININGQVFYIDEEAFEVLHRYLEALKKNFRNTEGGDEILADIEARIAEMLTERLKNRNEVVSMDDVQAVVAAMGQPEDMEGEDEKQSQNPGSGKHQGNTYWHHRWGKDYGFNPGKRMYRDPDNKVLGGVCSGIGEYLGIDPVWVRVLFVIVAFFGFGTGLIVYIILWAIIPAAKTPSEKLEMRGERINISNIEKTVKENLENLKERIDKEFEDFDGKKFGGHFNSFFHGLFEGLGGALQAVFFVFTKLLSVFAIMIAICVLICIVSVVLGALGIISINVPVAMYDYFGDSQRAWLILILVAALIGLPFLGMMLRGIRHLSGYRGRSRFINAFFSFLWVIVLVMLVVFGFGHVMRFKSSYTFSTNDILKKPAHDTLYLNVNPDEVRIPKYHGNGWTTFDRLWNHTDGEKDKNQSGQIYLDINRSADDKIRLERSYYSRGNTFKEAQAYCQSIQYSYLQRDSNIIFDETYSIPADQKWRGQNADLDLQVPDGMVVVLRKGMEDIIYDVDNDQDMYDGDMPKYTWKMTPKGLTCTDCAGYQKGDGDDDDGRHHHHHHRFFNRQWDFSF